MLGFFSIQNGKMLDGTNYQPLDRSGIPIILKKGENIAVLVCPDQRTAKNRTLVFGLLDNFVSHIPEGPAKKALENSILRSACKKEFMEVETTGTSVTKLVALASNDNDDEVQNIRGTETNNSTWNIIRGEIPERLIQKINRDIIHNSLDTQVQPLESLTGPLIRDLTSSLKDSSVTKNFFASPHFTNMKSNDLTPENLAVAMQAMWGAPSKKSCKDKHVITNFLEKHSIRFKGIQFSPLIKASVADKCFLWRYNYDTPYSRPTSSVETGKLGTLLHNSLLENQGFPEHQGPEISGQASMNASQSLIKKGSSYATTPKPGSDNNPLMGLPKSSIQELPHTQTTAKASIGNNLQSIKIETTKPGDSKQSYESSMQVELMQAGSRSPAIPPLPIPDSVDLNAYLSAPGTEWNTSERDGLVVHTCLTPEKFSLRLLDDGGYLVYPKAAQESQLQLQFPHPGSSDQTLFSAGRKRSYDEDLERSGEPNKTHWKGQLTGEYSKGR